MIIIDAEIKKAILGRNEKPIAGIEYCGGWRDFANMGIACVCTFDIVTGLSRMFLEDDLPTLIEYLRGKPTAGFNTKRFDNTLLHHHGVDVEKVGGPHYDILEEIWLAMGLDPNQFVPRTHGGWGLDAVCRATLGIKKTGHGALAPVWWQSGQRGKVIDYCLNDVWMEGSLLKHIIQHGSVNREGFGTLFVRKPDPLPPLPDVYSVHTEWVKQELATRQQETAIKASMDVNNIVGGPNEPALAAERRADREAFERRAAQILNEPIDVVTPVKQAAQQSVDEMAKKVDRDVISGGLGIIR